jgi:hypothetical protein
MYEKDQDHSAISVFESKKPVYDKDTNTYRLDFYGRADVSIKNLILGTSTTVEERSYCLGRPIKTSIT